MSQYKLESHLNRADRLLELITRYRDLANVGVAMCKTQGVQDCAIDEALAGADSYWIVLRRVLGGHAFMSDDDSNYAANVVCRALKAMLDSGWDVSAEPKVDDELMKPGIDALTDYYTKHIDRL